MITSKNDNKKVAVLFSDSYTINPITLRKSILAFDNVKIIDLHKHKTLIPFGSIKEKFVYPNGKSTVVGQGNYGSVVILKGETRNYDAFINEIDVAIKRNVVLPVDPNPALKKRAILLKSTYCYDLANDKLIEIASKGINNKIISESKIIDTDYADSIEGMHIAVKGFKSIWSSLPRASDKPFGAIQDEDKKGSLRILTWARITKVLTALALVAEYDAIPVSDNDILMQIILEKYRWLTSISEESIKDIILKEKDPNSLKYHLLARAVIEDIFSDEELLNIPLRKLIAYKRTSKEEQARFYSKIDRVINLIQSEVWDDNLEREIKLIISKDVAPELDKFIEKKLKIKDKTIGVFIKGSPAALRNSVKNFIQAKIAMDSSLSYILPGFTIPEILLFPGLFGYHFLRKTYKDFVDLYIEQRANNRNSFTYLLKLKKT